MAELTSIVLRTGSSIIPQDPLAHRLVLSGLATLVHVDMNGSRCLIKYVPEPLVANSARLKLLNNEAFVKGLSEYVRCLRLGVFHESGEAGEHVGRIVLLRLIGLISIYPQIGNFTSTDANGARIYSAISLSNEVDFEKVIDILERIENIRENTKFGSVGGASTSPLLSEKQLEELEKADTPARGRGRGRAASRTVEGQAQAASTSSGAEATELEAGQGDSRDAPISTTGTIASDPNSEAGAKFKKTSLLYTPILPLVTVRQFLLLASGGRFDDEFYKFGVSDEVFDGLVSFSQFVNMERPLVMNQVYLMQAFARGCALTPPARTIGVDAIIPVLRTDDRMSCIAVQFKNFDFITFPSNSSEVSAKLSSRMLNFLDFGKIGDFEAAPQDDFVRLVIQFGPKNEFSAGNLFSLTQIPTSISSVKKDLKDEQKSKSCCHALWVHGLHALDHLFFKDPLLLDLLNSILFAQHDVYEVMEYPKIPLPTFIQSTEEGARFLGRLARPLANYANLVPYEEQMRVNSDEFDWKILQHRMNLLQMPEAAFEPFKSCKISLKAPVVERPEIQPQAEPLPLPRTTRHASDSIQNLNSLYSGDHVALSEYQTNYRKFITTINTCYQPRIEGKINEAELSRRLAAQKIASTSEGEKLLKTSNGSVESRLEIALRKELNSSDSEASEAKAKAKLSKARPSTGFTIKRKASLKAGTSKKKTESEKDPLVLPQVKEANEED